MDAFTDTIAALDEAELLEVSRELLAVARLVEGLSRPTIAVLCAAVTDTVTLTERCRSILDALDPDKEPLL